MIRIIIILLIYSLPSNAQNSNYLNNSYSSKSSPKLNCLKIKDFNLMRSCFSEIQKVNIEQIRSNKSFQDAVKKRNLLHETNKNNPPKW